MSENFEENENEEEDYEESESQSDINSYFQIIEIKREKIKKVSLDVKTYHHLLTQMNNLIEIAKSVQEKRNITRNSSSQTEIEEKINTTTQKEEKTNSKESEMQNIINNLQIENSVLKSQIDLLRKENSKLISDFSTHKITSKEKISKLHNEILQLQTSLSTLNSTLQKQTQEMKQMKKISPIEMAFSHEKITDKILSYLPFEYTFHFLSLNNYLHSHFYYKQRCFFLEGKLQNAIKEISQLTTKDICEMYSITNQEMENLFEKRLNNSEVIATKLRKRIIRSLFFIDEIVKTPLRNIPEVQKLTEKMLTVIKDKSDNENEISELNDEIIDFPPKKYFGLHYTIEKENEKKDEISYDDIDKKILQYYSPIGRSKIKFDFSSSEEIRELLDMFFRAKLSKDHYANFLKCIVEEFSSLLYDSYETIKEAKEMVDKMPTEITTEDADEVNTLLESTNDITFDEMIGNNKTMMRVNEITEEINDLSRFAKSSKEIKEMLLKQKSEVEIKYNDALIQISSLLNEKERYKKTIEDIDKERVNCEKEFEEFKAKLINEFKAMQNESKLIVRERDALKGTLIDFKNFFMKFVNDEGEIIN